MLLPLLLAAASLPQQMEQIAAAARGHTGAAVLVVETGRSAAFHGQDRFPMQSVYKFPIGMAVLHRVDQGALSLDQKLHVAPGDLVPAGVHSPLRDKHPQGNIDVSVSELLRLTISESDGAASDVLMRAAGGAGSVTQSAKHRRKGHRGRDHGVCHGRRSDGAISKLGDARGRGWPPEAFTAGPRVVASQPHSAAGLDDREQSRAKEDQGLAAARNGSCP